MNNKQTSPIARTPNIVIVGFVLAILLPPIGFVISILAWRKTARQTQKGKPLAILGTLLGFALSIPVLFFIWLLFALGGGFHGHGNDAESASKPLVSQIKQLGGNKICDNGDSGYGIDNTQPWYQVYYQIPDNTNLTKEIKDAAMQDGYQLQENTAFINQLKGLPDANVGISEPYGGEQFNPHSDYLTGKNDTKTLTITINRQASVALYCDVSGYGRKQQTGNSTAILNIYLGLPDRIGN